MKEEFKAAENQELYDWGKKLEDEFYRPQIEAEKHEAERRSRGTRDGEQRSNGASRSHRDSSQSSDARSSDRRRGPSGPRP